MAEQSDETTHFGYQDIPKSEKTERVNQVFESVASRYDVMNDLMSLGVHRLWKRFTIQMAALKVGQKVLDVASGSGDLSLHFAKAVQSGGLVVMADISSAMLNVGRQKCLNHGIIEPVEYVIADGESLPFFDNYFDCVCSGFGLRNMTNKDEALSEMYRVIKPGGRVLILEFSKPTMKWLAKCYDAYSFNVLPWLGKMVCNDEASYRYLVESIRLHPDQETLKGMMEQVGFTHCDYNNLSAGIVAVHKGFKF